jgi:hypothetical protein
MTAEHSPLPGWLLIDGSESPGGEKWVCGVGGGGANYTHKGSFDMNQLAKRTSPCPTARDPVPELADFRALWRWVVHRQFRGLRRNVMAGGGGVKLQCFIVHPFLDLTILLLSPVRASPFSLCTYRLRCKDIPEHPQCGCIGFYPGSRPRTATLEVHPPKCSQYALQPCIAQLQRHTGPSVSPCSFWRQRQLL